MKLAEAYRLNGSAQRLLTLVRTDRRVQLILWPALLVAAFLPINLIMQLVWGISVLKPLQLWLLENRLVTDDSWRPMLAALDWVRTGPDGSLYQEIFFKRNIKFQYPPTSLLPLVGIDALGLQATPLLLNVINRVLLLASAVGVGALGWILLKRQNTGDPLIPALGAIVFGGATFFYFPMTYGYQLGQVQVWGNAFFIFACLAWVLNRKAAAGVLVGLICLLKPQLALFLVWAVLRKEWKFLAGGVATGAIALVLSVALFGFKNHLAYIEALQFMSRHGEAHLSNHSFNSFLHRLTGNDDGLAWSNAAFSPFNPIVYAGSLLATVATLIVGLWLRGGSDGEKSLMQFLLAALTFTIASPIAWEPHYGVLAPALVAVFCAVLAMPQSPARRMWLIGLAAIFVASANHFPVVALFAHTPLIPLQSYILIAGIGMMWMLWRLTDTARPTPASVAGE